VKEILIRVLEFFFNVLMYCFGAFYLIVTFINGDWLVRRRQEREYLRKTTKVAMFGGVPAWEIPHSVDKASSEDVLLVHEALKDVLTTDTLSKRNFHNNFAAEVGAQYKWAWEKHSGADAVARAALMNWLVCHNMFDDEITPQHEGRVVLLPLRVLGWRNGTRLVAEVVKQNNFAPIAVDGRYENWFRSAFTLGRDEEAVEYMLSSIRLIVAGAKRESIIAAKDNDIDLDLMTALLDGDSDVRALQNRKSA